MRPDYDASHVFQEARVYEWILLAHLIGAAVLFGGHVYMEGTMASAGRETDRSVYMSVMLRMSKTAGRLMGPASVITLVFGIWLVFEGSWEFEELFVVVGFVVIIAAMTIALFLMNPKLKDVEEAVAENGLEDEGALANMKSIGNLVHVQTLLIAVAFIVMVIRP